MATHHHGGAAAPGRVAPRNDDARVEPGAVGATESGERLNSATVRRHGGLDRDRLPDPITYYESEGLSLTGRGRWRTACCLFHGGSDSFRINVEAGAFVCMAGCGARGGDVLAFHMARHGLGFVEAARSLGAWIDDGRPGRVPTRPRPFSARDALSVVETELNVAMVVLSDARQGITPTDDDWQRFLQAAGRVDRIAQEAAR